MENTPSPNRITPDLLARLHAWVGRTEVVHDQISPTPMRCLAATLDQAQDEAVQGTALPPLWHWLYFLPTAPQHQLGSDGHPRVGNFLPPVPLPRRMWAGGRLQWHGDLRVGEAVQRTSRIVSVTHKSGRSGDLMFVVVRHEIANAVGLVLTEEQDIVYRAAAQAGDAPVAPQPAPQDAAWSRQIVPDPVLLFRYSAVTFNGHRIHYDRRYAAEVESYAGLVVHGPLLATLLADLALRECPASRIAAFSFKAVRPTQDPHPFRVCGRPGADGKSARLWAQDHEAWLTMQADVRFE